MSKAKTSQVLLSTATVMLGPMEEVNQLTPEKHSLGLVKNVTYNTNPEYRDLTQGLGNDTVMSVKIADSSQITMEVYEYTSRNLAYAAGLDGTSVEYNPLTVSYFTSATPTGTVVRVVGTATGIIAGDFISIQGMDDAVHIAKVASVSGSTINLQASYAIPASLALPAVSQVRKVRSLDIGARSPSVTLGCKIVGIINPTEATPITLVFPKVRITRGLNLAFSTDNFGHMPFEFVPQSLLLSDALYSEFADAKVRMYVATSGNTPPPANTAPTITVAPTQTGSAPVGSTLTTNPGTASGYPAPTASIQWLRNGTAIAGATGVNYTTVPADQGTTISARVTWSNGTSPNAQATTTGITITAALVAPTFTTQPSLTGSTALGSTITVSLGTASGIPTPTLTGTLTRPGKAPATVANGHTFQIEAADQGGTITLDVTATNSAGRATASAGLAVPAAAITAQRVILLTDYAGDCDDAAALLIASDAHKKQEIDILGVVVTSTIATSAPGVYGQLAAYGMQDVPVYAYQGSLGTYNNNISAPVRDAFGVPGQTRAAFENDVMGLRRMLAAAPDASVKVIDIGAPVSLARLLDSPADAISPMTGMQLVAAKVTGLWAMAGNFPTGTAEYNMTRHIPSSQRVFHDWPTPIYAHGGEVGGDVFTGPPAGSQAVYDPVKVAFDAHPALTNGKRQSWDPVALHHAIYGNDTLYTLAGQGGTITIDSAGVSTWSATPAGNRAYVAKAASASQVASALQAIIDTADLLVVKPSPPALNRIFPVMEGTGTVLTADSGDKASIMGASWASAPARLAFNGSSSRVEMQFFPAEFSDDDFLLGAVVRFATTSGTRVIAARSANPNLLRYFQFRQTGGALEYVSFNYLGDTTPAGATIISSAAGAVAANIWALATVHVADTSAILRLNGVQVATGTFAQRTNTLDDTTPIMWGARRRDATTITDHLSGDIAAMGVRFGAAPADASDFEAQLRAIATAKGITLPGGTAPVQSASPYQPDMTTGRIAPITMSFGGRPNVTPATYYFDGQDELASMSMGA